MGAQSDFYEAVVVTNAHKCLSYVRTIGIIWCVWIYVVTNAHCREGICCTFLIPIVPSQSANHRVWLLNAVEPLQAVYTCREEHKHQSSCVSDCLPLIVYANMFRHTNTAHTYTQQINTHILTVFLSFTLTPCSFTRYFAIWLRWKRAAKLSKLSPS